MKFKQLVRRDGYDLLIIISDESGKVVGTRVWKDAVRYMTGDYSMGGNDRIVIELPMERGLDIRTQS